MVLFWLTLLCIPALLLAACSAKEIEQDSGIVASVGDDFTIHFPRLHAFHSNHEFGARFPDSELNGYEEALSLLITNRLKVNDFFESEMHRDSAMALELQRIVNDELINEYFEEVHLGRYVNKESIREYYDGMSKEIHFRQIVLGKTQAEVPESWPEIQNTIDDILTAAQDGESFETLKAIYLGEQASSRHSENSTVIKWQENSRNQMFNQLYDLNEGDIKVLETASSFIIIKADQITQQEVPPLDQVRQSINSNLRTMYYNKSQNEFVNEKEGLLNRESFQWHQRGVEQLLEWAALPDFYIEMYRDTLKDRIESGDNFMILTHADGHVNAEEYLRLLDEVYIIENPRSAGIDEHKKFITEALERDGILIKAKEMGLDEHILNPNRPNQMLQNRVMLLYNKEKINSKVPEPNKQDVREFYEAYKETKFYQLPRVRVFALVYDNSEKAEDAIRRHDEGTRFEDLESVYQVRTFERKQDGEIETYIRREKPYLGEIAFNMNDGEVTGPVSYDHVENGKLYAVVKRASSIPEKQLSYSEVEDRIESVYKDYHRKQIVESVKEDLWDRYSVEIFRENLRHQISSL